LNLKLKIKEILLAHVDIATSLTNGNRASFASKHILQQVLLGSVS